MYIHQDIASYRIFPLLTPPILYNICSIPKLLPQVQVLRALRLRGLPNQRYLAAASVSWAKVESDVVLVTFNPPNTHSANG